MYNVDPKHYPPPFVPPPSGPAGARASTWILTRHGRLRRHLAQVRQTPTDAQAVEALKKSYRQLVAAGEVEAITDSSIEETLLFLAWAGLRQDNVSETTSWLEELDKRKPSLPAGAALRWQLLSRLLEAGNLDAYTAQARLFLANPAVDFKTYDGAVLETLSAVYERIAPADCAALIAAAHPGLQRHATIKACLDLCHCPATFDALKDAQAWAKRINPEVFTFSRMMRSDALLVRARAAEWAGDLRSMYLHSVAAMVEEPDHLPARYWMVRTKLYAADADPMAGIDPSTVPDTTGWQRLVRLTRLYQQPTFEHAAEFVPWLEDSETPLDPSEKQLTITLLKKALTISPNWEPEQVAQCSRLCDQIEGAVGRQPWTQLNIAIQEIARAGRYVAAVERLEQDDVRKESQAPVLARIARILSGTPTFAGQADQPGLLMIESAMRYLLSPGKQEIDGLELVKQLAAVRDDRWCREFPIIGFVADVLRFAVGVLAGGEAAQSLAAMTDLPPLAPAWARWLNARAAILQAMAGGATVLPEAFDHTDEMIGWEAQQWAAIYDERTGEIPAVVSTPPAARDLGQLCESLCQTEASFAAAYLDLRSKLRSAGYGKGRFEEALAASKKLAKALAALPAVSREWWSPETVYWTGVVSLHRDSRRAARQLEKLVNGPKSAAARAQLALLAIQRGDLDAADAWVADETSDQPAWLYAQSLLLARRDQPEAACERLSQLEATCGATASPYLLAARRLRAALAERSGSRDESEALHRATLADYPSDPITSARLARLLFQRAYQNRHANYFAENGEVAGLLEDAAEKTFAPVGWSVSLLATYRLLTATEQQITAEAARFNVDEGLPATALAIAQVMIRRLLECRRPQAAWEVLEKTGQAIDSSASQRTVWVLKAWRHLSSVWTTYQPPALQETEAEVARIRAERGFEMDGEAMWQLAEARVRQQAIAAAISQESLQAAAACLREIEGGDESDEVMRRWRFLLSRAAELHADGQMDLTPEHWNRLAPWIIGVLPGLFAPEATDRAQAMQALAERLLPEDHLNAEQRRLLEALSAYAAGREDDFLVAITELEPVLELLPVDAATVWLAAAHVRFKRKMWTPIIDGFIPDSLADYSNPQVRLLIGLAHARAALDDIAKDGIREAQKKIRQARTVLAPLLGG